MIRALMLLFVLRFTLAQDLQVLEEELNGNAKYLNMSSRGIKDTVNLESIKNLEIADFSNNEITRLDWRHIVSAPVLTTLDLSGNADLTLPENGPSHEIPLRVLNMSNCNIKTVGKNALAGLSNLEVLDLRQNPIAFEESEVFVNLETPPKRLIVSTINKRELRSVCLHVDMKVEIIDDDVQWDCKDVRRDNPAFVAPSSTREKMAKEVVVDELFLPDTHMQIQADEPTEGSGNDEIIGKTSQEEAGSMNEPAEEENTELPKNTIEDPNKQDAKPEVDGLVSLAPEKPAEMFESKVDEAVEIKEDTAEEKTVFEEDTPTVESKPEEKQKIAGTEKDTNDQDEWPTLEHHGHSHKDTPIARQPSAKSTVVSVKAIDAPPPSNEKEAAVGETKTGTESSTGKNVILVLIVGAVMMGSIIGLLKMYRDRKRNERNNLAEGREMKEVRRPLMNDRIGATNGDNKNHDGSGDSAPKVVVVDGSARPLDTTAMTTKEIIENPANLPDIDDSSRLSTIIVSTPNLEDTK